MTETSATNPIRLPVLKMGVLSMVTVLVITAAGGALGSMQGRPTNDALWVLAPVIPSVLVTLLVLNALPSRNAAAWSIPVLGGTMLRALIALGLAVAVYLGAGPDKFVFFLTLASSLVGVLIVDVIVSVGLIKASETARPSGVVMEGA